MKTTLLREVLIPAFLLSHLARINQSIELGTATSCDLINRNIILSNLADATKVEEMVSQEGEAFELLDEGYEDKFGPVNADQALEFMFLCPITQNR